MSGHASNWLPPIYSDAPPSDQNYFRSEFKTVKTRITCERLQIDEKCQCNTNSKPKSSRRDTLKPTWQDFSALNFDSCGFTGVIIVVLNTKFKLASIGTLILAVFV